MGEQTIRGVWVAVLVGAIALSGPAAQAANTRYATYGQDVVCGDLSASTYVYAQQDQWTTGLKSLFGIGFSAWTSVKKWSGGNLLSVSGTQWTARWDSLPSSTNARTVCLPWAHNIEFNISKWADYQNGAISMASVSAHEWGHAFGLGHVGVNDAVPLSAGPPTMATCVPDLSSSSRATLTNDDNAAITAQFEAVGGYATITANASFEQPEVGHKAFWLTQNLDSFTASSSGGGADGSPWYGQFRASPGVTNGAIYSDTFVTAHTFSSMKARANYRRHQSNDYGYVQVTMRYRPWTHNGGSCGGLTATSVTGPWVLASVYCYPGTSWGYCTTGTLQRNGAPAQVLQMRVVVYNRMQRPIDGGSINTFVRVDRTRVMVDGPA